MSAPHKRVFTQVFAVVASLIERDGKFLMVKEDFGPEHPDDKKWNLPAGWIDVGENPLEAVRRETREETGYDFTPTHLLSVSSLVRKDIAAHFISAPHALKLIFLGTIPDKSSAPLAGDTSEVRWFTPEEIVAMDTKTLRDIDIKRLVKDYLTGLRYSLDILHHTVAE